ncbi:MAG: biotin/lipoyl-binding protein [Antarcticimicrobium sp.]|uniref:biotin/lipoyl-binding protein n=1 Tax=Antarcticimicrobium sp. TaxID=2824147 RepID=UPI0026277242|nr:biotin/lipoyl-binding protein [Antarcticimicrobium sp.]MDF1717382.1 biotin/lipoyl-binding protein [Antarcticimicrobium sp.]
MTRLSLILALCCISLPALAAPPLAVEIVTVEEKAETRAFSLTGEIVARDPVELSFPAGGRLAEVPVEAGDQVEAGAVLARLDAVQQQQALRAAEAALDL